MVMKSDGGGPIGVDVSNKAVEDGKLPKKQVAKKRNAKKVKDENAPKRATSAYFEFMRLKRPEIKISHPDATFGEMGKLLGTLWSSMSEEDKAPYNELAANDRERHAKETTAYIEANPSVMKAMTKPKRPLSAFLIFSQDNREAVKVANPSATFGDMGKLLGEQWRTLSDDAKQPYHAKAAQAKKDALAHQV